MSVNFCTSNDILNPYTSALYYANNKMLWKLKYYTGFTELHTSLFYETSIIYVV